MDGLERLVRNYRTAFLRYLPRRDEAALAAAYQLGRSAVADGVDLLELVRVHHDVLAEVLGETPPDELADVVAKASSFQLEVLAPYDMAQRGFLEGTRRPELPGR
jgi:hypothetical protein